jgi:DNA repair protein RadC
MEASQSACAPAPAFSHAPVPLLLPAPAAAWVHTLATAPLPAHADGVPVQLDLPAMPPRVPRRPPLPRHKRIWPGVHLMADIPSTSGFCYGEEPAAVPVLYTRDDTGFHVAADGAVLVGAHALLKKRFRRGVPIVNYPVLLKQFLPVKVGCHQCSVFLAIFLDRAGRLIQVAELFRGTTRQVIIHPKEIVRAALACEAESVLCARTDASGNSEPTQDDIGAARWLRRTFEMMEMPLVDYIVVGDTMTSLARKGVFLGRG